MFALDSVGMFNLVARSCCFVLIVLQFSPRIETYLSIMKDCRR